jgi:hypothetical protein
MNNMRVQDLNEHKKAFYIGSILPDLKPSFLTKRHTIDETFETLIKEIKKITVDYDINRGINGYYARHLGVITHYLSDYCTFPHNSIFEGSITEHVYYEKELKFSLKAFLLSDAAQREREKIQQFNSIDEIIRFIIKTHKDYLKALKNVKGDIQYITELCYNVVDAILLFFEMAFEKLQNGFNHKNNLPVEYSQA